MDFAIDKEPALLDALDRLRSKLGPAAFVLADHWESDRCAVGIASPSDPGVLAYISCYGEQAGKFNYELELPPLLGDSFPYQVAGRGDGVSLDRLADVVCEHLKRARPVR